MRPRRLAGYLAVVLSATLLSPIVLRPAPGLAHTTCAASSETDYYPSPSPWSDGETVRIRMVSPVSGAGCSKPAAGWPLIIYLHGYSTNRCENMSFASRAQMAAWGYVVMSFTARGKPASAAVGLYGCNANDDATDALDDNGHDFTGPRDKLDVTQLINWARDNYTPSNCADQCVDDSLVGVTGFSYGGMRSWMAGVPNPPNSQFDSRVKAVAPVAAGMPWNSIKNLSNDGATPTPAVRPKAVMGATYLWWGHPGWSGHTDRPVLTNANDSERARYRNEAEPQAAVDYGKARTLVDDDSTIDQAADITIPVFVMNGWLDGQGGVYAQYAIEAYNKLTTANKYLYLGSCTHGPDPCHANNATKMRDALHRFFDRWVRLDTTISVGGPIFYTVPPKYTDANNNPWLPTGQTWTEQTASAWPPTNFTTTTYYFRNDGTLSTTSETGSTCTRATSTGCREFDNTLNYPQITAFCYGLTYGPTEYKQFDTSAMTADKKLIKLDADLWLSTNTTRLQVYVDLFDLNGSGTELARIWQGTTQIVPIKRDAVADTVYRFVFVPGAAGWTVANGHKIRVKVASRYQKAFAPEPLPGKYTLYHNDTYKSNVKATWAP